MANNNPNYTVIIKQVPDARNPKEPGPTVTAPMPEDFNFDSASSYSAPFAQGMQGNGIISNIIKAAGGRLTHQALTAQLWDGSTTTSLSIVLEFHTETDPVKDVHDPIMTLMKMATASVDSTTGMLLSPGPRIKLSDIIPAAADVVEGASVIGESLSKIGGAISETFATWLPGNASKPASLQSPTSSTNGAGDPKATPSATVQFLKRNVSNQITIQIGQYIYFDSVVINNVRQTYSNQIDSITGLPLHARVDLTFEPLFLVVQSDLDNIFARAQ